MIPFLADTLCQEIFGSEFRLETQATNLSRESFSRMLFQRAQVNRIAPLNYELTISRRAVDMSVLTEV